MTKQRESKLSGKIQDALRLEGVFVFKVHGSEYMQSGLPDLIACVDGQFVGLETKNPEARAHTSRIQNYRMSQIRDAGGVAEVVCSVPEALGVINRVRAARRDRA